jgi:gliding motility-associated lipoprotein GldD
MTKKNILFSSIAVILSFSCTDYIPKPYGYFRIELKDHTYKKFPDDANFSFSISTDAVIDTIKDPYPGEWFDINYPLLNAKIHCSYLPITSDKFNEAAEDSHKFVYRHAPKADAITNLFFSNPEQNVYSILYEVKGNVASPIQFILTDSTRNFFRGALYFDCVNQDSLTPVISYLKEDINEIINSFSWKNN